MATLVAETDVDFSKKIPELSYEEKYSISIQEKRIFKMAADRISLLAIFNQKKNFEKQKNRQTQVFL